MSAQGAQSEANMVEAYSKIVTDEYGNPHTLHIDASTAGTIHKHSGKPESDDICPFCNDDVDYGYGIEYDGDALPIRT